MVLTQKELNTATNSVCAKLCAELAKNNLIAGTKLKPIQLLAKDYNVSYLTAQRAIKKMQKEGILESRRGDGTYVTIQSQKFLNNFLKENNSQNLNTAKMEKTYSIGLILPYWMNITNEGALAFHRIIKSFLSQIDKHGWRVEMINNGYHEAAMPDFVEKLVQKQLDGVYWIAPQPEHRMNLMRLIDKGIDVVTTGRNFPEIPVTTIFVDLGDMANKVADFCVKKKKKNIVILCGVLDGELKDTNSANFVKELRGALLKNNIELTDEQIGQTAIFTPDNNILKQLSYNFLKKHPKADAIISYHEEFFPVIEQLDKENFWENPEKMSIVDVNAEWGFNNSNVGRIPVNKILMPIEDMGCASALEFEKKWLGTGKNIFDLRVSLVPANNQ